MEKPVIYKDASYPIPERVEDLLSRMTVEEKVAQLCGNLPDSITTNGKVDPEKLRNNFPDGHGRFTQYSMLGVASPKDIAEASNEIQRYFVEETRLGIPVALQSENLCGYPAAEGTMFPSMLNLASTWEPELAKEMAAVIGQESRAVGINSAMSPVIDVSRDPRWGRTYETFGEDPYLVSQMGVNYINGMQGEDKEGPACIAKHFLGYAETQGGLNCAAARIGDRELYEIFATPFEAAVKEADVSGMMANYGEIDGLNICANPKIAKTLLRDTMKFEGMLTSDGGGVMRLWKDYKLARSHAEAGLLAKKSGLDTEIPVGNGFAALVGYVQEGKLEESVLDESVRRILTIKFAYGLFEHPYVDIDTLSEKMTNPAKRRLSEQIAEKSITLLKNTGILPLKQGTKLAVIGPHADSLRDPISGYTYPAMLDMMGYMAKMNAQSASPAEGMTFGGIADEMADRKETQKADPVVDVHAGPKIPGMVEVLREMGASTLKEELEKQFDVAYARGCSIMGDETDGFAEAVTAAKNSDVVIMALGGNCGWVGTTGGEGKDRSSLALPGVQQQLLETVAAAGKPVVVILYGPGCFSVPWAAEHTAAILQAWLPGASAGKAVAEVLSGVLSPEGKLPLTVPRSVGQVPIYYNHKVGSGYTDGESVHFVLAGGYVNEPGSPLYPFGYGLSYTTFAVSDLKVDKDTVPTDGQVSVSCLVKNTGDRDGAEVVQLYTHFMDAHVTRPNKSLSGFQKVHLKAGEEKEVTFTLDMALLGYYNENMEFVVEPGELNLMVGTSSDDLPCRTSIQLTGDACDVLGRRAYHTASQVG